MTPALYLTIWIGLLLFALGELGRTRSAPASRAWYVSLAGLLLTAAHFRHVVAPGT